MNELLTQLLQAAKARGLEGIAVVQHGNQFLALCLGKSGLVCDPRTWDYHPTPEAALTNLASVMKVTIDNASEVTA